MVEHCDEIGVADYYIIKYILATLYGSLGVASIIVLFFVWRARPAERYRCRVPLHFFLAMSATVRFILQLVPFSAYCVIKHILWLQVLLDLLPELLFWQTFVLLVLLCGSAMIVFMRYGYLTHKKLDKVPLYPAHRKEKRLNMLKFTVISVVICNLTHIIYLYIVDVIDLSTSVHIGEDAFLWVWMFYFIFTEIVPGTAILIVFRKPPHHSSTSSSQRSTSKLSINQYTPLSQTAAPSYADSYLPKRDAYSSSYLSYGAMTPPV